MSPNSPMLPAVLPDATAPLVGVVLAGGQSRRMGAAKWALDYHGEPQAHRTARLLGRRVRPRRAVGRRAGPRPAADLPVVADARRVRGPAAGILAALAAFPGAALLVVAVRPAAARRADARRRSSPRATPARLATAFRSPRDGSPEPLCAVWEPAAAAVLAARGRGRPAACPRRFLHRRPAAGRLPRRPRPRRARSPTPTRPTTARPPSPRSRDVPDDAPPGPLLAVPRRPRARRRARRDRPATPRALFDELFAPHPPSRPRPRRGRASPSTTTSPRGTRRLADGDTVVFLAPSAGG